MGRKKQHHVDEAQLRELVDEGLTMPAIAARLGVGLKVVRARLQEFGIEWERKTTMGQRRVKLPEDFLRREYVEKQRSATDIAKEAGTTHKTVLDRLRELGIPVRANTEYEREHRDWTGVRVGLLTPLHVIEERKVYSEKPVIVWSCRCDCGNLHPVPAVSLATENTRSCGCLKQAHERRKWVGEISSTYWGKLLDGAAVRGIEVHITAAQAWAQFEKQGGVCPLTGKQLRLGWTGRTASLDRIDSSGHYTLDNIQWVWKPLNRAKGTMTSSEFIDMCCAVADYARKQMGRAVTPQDG